MDVEVIGALIAAVASLIASGLALVGQRGLQQRQEQFELEQREIDRAHASSLQETSKKVEESQRVLEIVRSGLLEAHSSFLEKVSDFAHGCLELGNNNRSLKQVSDARDRGDVTPDTYERRVTELKGRGEPYSDRAVILERELLLLEETIRGLVGEEMAANYRETGMAARHLLDEPYWPTFQESRKSLVLAYHENLTKPLI